MYLPNGTLLQGGKYKVVRHISSGGFGNTYEGEHVLIHRRVAIKEFFVKDFCNRENSTGRVTVATQSKVELIGRLKHKFTAEAAHIWQFNHPNIVRVTDIFEENDTAYYVMDYIDGMSLHDMLKRDGAMAESQALHYIRQVAGALQYVHDRKLLHLDIKPGNIMVDVSNNAILIDFGASKQYDEQGENTSTLLGLNTIGFAPPEQMSRSFTDFNPAADVYALGATLYRMLTNVTPPDSVMLASGDAELAPLPSSVSAATCAAVAAAMVPQRKRRTQSIGEFLSQLAPHPSAAPEVADQSAEGDDEVIVAEMIEAVESPVVPKTEQAQRPAENPKHVGAAQKVANPVKPKAEQERYKSTKPSKRGKWIAGGAVAAVLLVAAIGIAYSTMGRGAGDSPTTDTLDSLANTDSLQQEIIAQRRDVIEFKAAGVSFNMRLVEAGTFEMGSEGYEAYPDEEPVHSVTISKDYYIGETEVTQALWKAVMGYSPTSDGEQWNSTYGLGDDYPAYYISYDDVQTFIEKLNEITRQTFRMPTEAEWEYAAKGGNKSEGYTYSGSNTVNDVAWYEDNAYRPGNYSSDYGTHPVTMKRSNELGLYDMSGNVKELCSDWYDGSYYKNSAVTDPTGPSPHSTHVRRGGGWQSSGNWCRLTFRGNTFPRQRDSENGFRLALSASE